MTDASTWSVVSTIKASTTDILSFAAHYLDLGAFRVHIYLDEDQHAARSALKRHPRCRVILTDEAYWKRRRRRRGRPTGHQYRQTLNATHCYRRNPDVGWLLHADVDEFLQTTLPLQDQLAAVPRHVLSARVRPLEVMQSDPTDPPPDGQFWCKGFEPTLKVRRAQTLELYPRFGPHLNGGFVSHVAGKVFVRTGREDVTIHIHSARVDKVRDTNPMDLTDCHLIHEHARTWEHWRDRYRYRLHHGSYRPDVKAAAGYSSTAMTMHELLSMLEAKGGEPALRAFYDDVCVATADLRKRLARHNHLHLVRLDLDAKRARHFPNHA